jgi:hypothetical protein
MRAIGGAPPADRDHLKADETTFRKSLIFIALNMTDAST